MASKWEFIWQAPKQEYNKTPTWENAVDGKTDDWQAREESTGL